MSDERPYEGQELELFAAATNWKSYWSGRLRPHLGGSVLEVGAGLGANTVYLHGPQVRQWLCLEPDGALAAQIPMTLAGEPWRESVAVRIGTLAQVDAEEMFDTLIYIDVLEHIEDDRAELRAAFAHLRPGGKITVLSPAYPSLYTAFDKGLGHYRRYTRAAMRACTPPGAELVSLFFLDSVGACASVANKLFLHQSLPSAKQIQFWDRWLVTASHLLDPLIAYSAGKSLIGIWRKP